MNQSLVSWMCIGGLALAACGGGEAPADNAPVAAPVERSGEPLPSPHVIADSEAARREYYTCPQHPALSMEQPGKCPSCGAELQPPQK